MIAPSRGEGNRWITQRKAEPPIFTYVGLWLDAGLQKGDTKRWRSGAARPLSTFLPLKQAQRWGRELSEPNVPTVAHNSGMHAVWQLGGRAPRDRQFCAPGPAARWCTLAA